MTPAKTHSLRLNWIILSALCLLCIAGCLRFTSLGNLPGINADEAFMGVKVLQMLHGGPYSFRTPAGQYINPAFIVAETFLLKLYPADFYLLRLPAALFAAMGILLMMLAYGWMYRDWRMAMVLGAVLGCFPMHLISSRLGWDATFLLFWTPALLYLFARLLEKPGPWVLWLLPLVILLSLWTHLTIILFVVALVISLVWMKRTSLARRLGIWRPNAFFFLGMLVAAMMIWIAWWLLLPHMRVLASFTPGHTMEVWRQRGSTALHLRLLGDQLTGSQVLTYVTGYPITPAFEALGWMAEGVLILCWIKLVVKGNELDRFFAVSLLCYVVLLAMASGYLNLHLIGHQRYVMPTIVLLPLLLVRAWRRPMVWLVLCVIFLGEYWICFERPTLECRYIAGTVFTFRTGVREPKAETAAVIRSLARDSGVENPTVFTNMFWMREPLEFLLFTRCRVEDWEGPGKVKKGDFIVGYAGDPYVEIVSRILRASGRAVETQIISNQEGVEEVVLAQIVK